MKKPILLGLSVVILSGCVASGQAPLVYVSKNTVGIEASGGVSDGGSVSLVIGYRGLDAAYVPTTAIASGATGALQPIRGCYNAGHNVGEVNDCDSGYGSTGNGADLQKDLVIDVGIPETNQSGEVNIKLLDPDDSGLLTSIVSGAEGNVHLRAGNQQQSVKDALSVYGSFDSESSVEGDSEGAKSGAGFGKVFATGVAAQNVTDGIAIAERRKAKALVIEKQTECLNALKILKDDGVTIDSAAVVSCLK